MIKKDMLKKIFGFTIVTLFLLVSILAPVVQAQEGGGKWYAPTYDEFTKKVFGAPDSQIFGERYTMAQVFWIVNSLPHVLTGSEVGQCMSGSNPLECMESLAANNSFNGPLFAVAGLTDATLSTKPLSGASYIRSKAAGLNIVPEAQAQEGFGFQTLKPALELWKITRNFAYALMTLIIIIFAFMIMFRIKISPQTVITVQSALPKIVIALLLITFSYAIAGLLVDLMYLILGVVSLLASGGNITQLGSIELFNKLVAPAPQYGITFLIVSLVFLIPGAGIAAITAALTGGLTLPIAAVGTLIALVGLIALFVAFLKILWVLLKSYVSVLLLVIAAPFFILVGAIRSELGFGSWFRSILSNLIVFPTIGILMFMANFFTFALLPPDGTVTNFISGSPFLNPYQFNTGIMEGSVQFPSWWASGIPDLLGILIGFTMIVIAPTIANRLKELVSGQQAFPWGSAIGEAMLPAPTKYAAGSLGEYYGARYKNRYETGQGATRESQVYSLLSRILSGTSRQR